MARLPSEYGPSETLYNRWKRWSGMDVFARMMVGLAAEADIPKTVTIDATYLSPQDDLTLEVSSLEVVHPHVTAALF